MIISLKSKRQTTLRTWFAGCLSLLFCCGTTLIHEAACQTGEAGATTRESSVKIHSQVLNEDRAIDVYLPDSYKPGSQEKYDVIYVLDGEMLARFFPPIRSFSEENDLIPPVIVVGIKNTYWYDRNQDSRDRDLLPAHVADSPLSGGADRFLDFLGTELVPYINHKYPTTGKTSLFGHSYAGMFTIYAFLKQHQFFDSYIASDPALWWNEGYVLSLARQGLAKLPKDRLTLYVGGRSGEMYEAFGIKQLQSLLTTQAPATLRWQCEAHHDEDHGSVRLKDIYEGLKFTYFGHAQDMVDFFPKNGIVMKGKPAKVMIYNTYLNESSGVRFTTDGTEPKVNSPRFDYGVGLAGPMELTVKQFSNWGPDKVVRGHFVAGREMVPTALQSGAKMGNLRHSCYEGSWDRIPDLHALAPTKSEWTDGRINISKFVTNQPFACAIDGNFESKKAGYYIFFLASDGAANLYIGNRLTASVGNTKEEGSSTSYMVPLSAGFYPIRIEYLHKSGDKNLSVTFLDPAVMTSKLAHLPIEIPEQLFYTSGDH